MIANSPILHIANFLYRKSYFTYRLLYRLYKAISDRNERYWIRQNLTEGMVVADIGANVGNYTEFMAKIVGNKCKVHAFEPDCKNFDYLKNLSLKYTNVYTYNCAISDKEEEIPFYISKYLNVDNRIYDDPSVLTESYKVNAKTLDSFFEPDQLNFIKMDIEGAEIFALEGGRILLEESQNLKILMEVWPYGLKKSGKHFKNLLNIIENAGYNYSFIGDSFSIEFAKEGKFDNDIGVYGNMIVYK